MSVSIKTPPRPDPLPSGQGAHGSSHKKRRASQSEGGYHKRRRNYAPFRQDPNFLKDPLNLSSIEPGVPVEPSTSYSSKSMVSFPVPRRVNVSDPLNLTIDDNGVPIGPLSPTGPYRRRKKPSKKLLQALEINFDSPAVTPQYLPFDAPVAFPGDSPEKSAELSDNDKAAEFTDKDDTGSSNNAQLTAASSASDGPVPSVEQLSRPAESAQIAAEAHPKPSNVASTSTTAVKPSQLQVDVESSVPAVTRPDKSTLPNRKRKDSDRTAHPSAKSRKKSLDKKSPSSGTAKPVNRPQPPPNTDPDKRSRNPYIYGNYPRYYGYRNEKPLEGEPRVKCFKLDWFRGKDVLDIGCNAGSVTAIIARDFQPRRVIGLDLDKKMIQKARQNLVLYKDKNKHPSALVQSLGPMKAPELLSDPAPSTSGQSNSVFPKNISFITGNYHIGNDAMLDMIKPEFHVVMALSVTKWIHLHHGDDGLKRCFKKMYKQLLPNGILILEPQMGASYKRRKLPVEMRGIFDEIQFKPDQFTEYLLSSEVGFSTCERLHVQEHRERGFRRPLIIFRKGLGKPKTPFDAQSPTMPSYDAVDTAEEDTALTETVSLFPPHSPRDPVSEIPPEYPNDRCENIVNPTPPSDSETGFEITLNNATQDEADAVMTDTVSQEESGADVAAQNDDVMEDGIAVPNGCHYP